MDKVGTRGIQDDQTLPACVPVVDAVSANPMAVSCSFNTSNHTDSEGKRWNAMEMIGQCDRCYRISEQRKNVSIDGVVSCRVVSYEGSVWTSRLLRTSVWIGSLQSAKWTASQLFGRQ